jgi:hypothetical protein
MILERLVMRCVRVACGSWLVVAPRAVAVGRSVRLSGRLRLHRRKLPPSSKLAELRAFDRGRRRTGDSRGSRTGPCRIRREAILPFELRYPKQALVRVR